jgi:SNF2 family DNA or RNA helicase
MRSEPFFLVPEDNPRIKKLLDVVSSLKSDKAIIWCKFRHEIADVAEALGRRCPDAGIVEFHGGIAQKARFVALERFKGPARFMIANKVCGGFGLNLQFAHQMIYYSNDFNWATRAQSEDRLHRIGQTKEVRIIDITASSKVDERILSNLSRKESLSDSFKENLRKGRAGLSAWLDGLEDKDDKARTERPAKTKRDTKLCCRA